MSLNKVAGVSLKPNGYLEYTTGPHKGRLVHVVVMEQQIGRHIGKNEIVHHKNGIKTDNRVDNLQLMSRSEHASVHVKKNHELGRSFDISTCSRKGEEHNNAKLTQKDVDEIRNNKDTPTKYFCEKFHVTRGTINKIKRGELWNN